MEKKSTKLSVKKHTQTIHTWLSLTQTLNSNNKPGIIKTFISRLSVNRLTNFLQGQLFRRGSLVIGGKQMRIVTLCQMLFCDWVKVGSELSQMRPQNVTQ